MQAQGPARSRTAQAEDFEGDERVEGREIAEFASEAYRSYAMYVIEDRALPDIGDGLKPVQRRVVFATHELGLRPETKPKKSARIVGDVLGKLHPHGDTACYEAMVRLAQEFASRYPLIHGQGNWGAIEEPKSFAAMRYTEAKLAPASRMLLDEIGDGGVQWKSNFDGTINEPVRLPAQLPLILCNGGQGIAVGMASDIPAHNAAEMACACLHLLDGGDQAGLIDIVPGPDLAGGGVCVSPKAERRETYRKGHGTLRIRARWRTEGRDVIVHELPPDTAASRVMEQIGEQMSAGKAREIAEMIDESDETQPVRMVLKLRSGTNPDQLMRHLFASTGLERSIRCNFTCLDGAGVPARRGIAEILREWLRLREESVRRRCEARLAKVQARLHIVEGLLKAIGAIDMVIEIVRNAEGDPTPVLIEKLGIDATQAGAVLALRVRALGRLEEGALRSEQGALGGERKALRKTLETPDGVRLMMREEIVTARERYTDPRRTTIDDDAAQAEARVSAGAPAGKAEPVTIVVSKRGWIRAAKGHQVDAATLQYRPDDALGWIAKGTTHDQIILLDSAGRSFAIRADTLPGARGLGEPLAPRFERDASSQWVGVLTGNDEREIVLGQGAGYGFRARIGQLSTALRAGKVAVTHLGTESALLSPLPREPGKDWLAMVTNDGYLLEIKVDELPEIAKGKGNKVMQCPKGVQVVAWTLATQDDQLWATENNGTPHRITTSSRTAMRKGRGRRGVKAPRAWRNLISIEARSTQ